MVYKGDGLVEPELLSYDRSLEDLSAGVERPSKVQLDPWRVWMNDSQVAVFLDMELTWQRTQAKQINMSRLRRNLRPRWACGNFCMEELKSQFDRTCIISKNTCLFLFSLHLFVSNQHAQLRRTNLMIHFLILCATWYENIYTNAHSCVREILSCTCIISKNMSLVFFASCL